MRLSKADQPDYKPADWFINRRPIYKPVRLTISLQHIHTHTHTYILITLQLTLHLLWGSHLFLIELTAVAYWKLIVHSPETQNCMCVKSFSCSCHAPTSSSGTPNMLGCKQTASGTFQSVPLSASTACNYWASSWTHMLMISPYMILFLNKEIFFYKSFYIQQWSTTSIANIICEP